MTNNGYDHLKAIADAKALEAQLAPAFQARLATLTVYKLKSLACAVHADIRGCRVRADWERAIEKVWRTQVWDEAGYRYGGHRVLSRSLMTQ